MLIRYNKNHEKIAMGLLSFNPDEKDLQKLLQTINEYVTEPNRQLYLWKEEEGMIGVIGVKIDDQEIQLQHLSVNPSHRDKGFGKLMIKELLELYSNKKLTATETTEAFVEKFDTEQSLEDENKKEHPLSVY
ncbi:MAG: GNAT family N-acetyltransferase [Bacillota bacterium]